VAARYELQDILDRVATDSYTEADIRRLAGAVRVRGDRNTVQVGGYIVRLREGRDIHIGDRIYQDVEAEMIRDVLADVVQIGRGSLRGFSGFIITVGVLIAPVGMAMFVYGLITMMAAPGIPSGPDPLVLQEFAIAFVGLVVAGLGQRLSRFP
jgi:hypothetical protein